MGDPKGLGPAGRALWRAVTGDYELEQHELVLLEQACRTADMVAALAAAVDDGPLTTGEGRIRPEVVEARQQRIVLARLLAALRVPLGEQNDDHSGQHGPPRLQRRSGARGVYRLPGAS